MIKNKYKILKNIVNIFVESSKYGLQVVYIDFEDLFLIKDKRVYVWGTSRHNTLYAMLQLPNGKNCKLHRFLLSPSNIEQIDHKDGNGLNNTRKNLRVTDSFGNNKNSTKRSNSITSKYKGVHYSKREGKWKAQIQVNKKKISLGTFLTELEAAKVYNIAALELHDEFAKLNNLQNAK